MGYVDYNRLGQTKARNKRLVRNVRVRDGLCRMPCESLILTVQRYVVVILRINN